MEALGIYLSPFFVWLLKTTIQAGVLICLIMFVKLILRQKLPIRWHYYLWLLLLIRLALPWSPQSRISIFNLMPQSNPQQHKETVKIIKESSDGVILSDGGTSDTGQSEMLPAQMSNGAVQSESQPSSDSASETITANKAKIPPVVIQPSRSQTISLTDVLPLIWLVGVLILAGYIFFRNIILWRAVKSERQVTDQNILELLEDCKMQMRIQTVVGVVVTDKVKSPALFGFVRPRLLLPQGLLEELDLDELQYVFLHELAHLRRNDIYFGWVVSLLQVLHWFNPLVWFAFRRMRTDQEMACDALALSTMNTEEPPKYGRTIINLFERFNRINYVPSIAGILEDRSQLERRIKMIAQFKKNSYQFSTVAVILIIVLGCVSLSDADRKNASKDMINKNKMTSIAVEQTGPITQELKISYTTGGMALSPDGNKLAYCRGEKGSTTNLVLRDLTTGDESDITKRGIFGTTPVFSSDGSRIAYTYWSDINSKTTVHIQDIETKEDKSLDFEGFVWDWSDDEKFLLVTKSPEFGGDGKTYILTIDGKQARAMYVPLDKGLFSPDSKYISYSKNGKVYLYTIDNSETTEIAKGSNPIWCPDGRTILFLSQQAFGPESDLCTVHISNSGIPDDIEIIKPDFIGQLISLSKTGRLLYSREYEERSICVAEVDPQTGQPISDSRRIAVGASAVWSPDGGRIAYIDNGALRIVSADGSNNLEIMKVNIAPKTNFVWSPESENIYMVEVDKQNQNFGLYAISLSSREKRLLLSDFVGHLTCSPDGKHIAFIKNGESSNYYEVFMIDTDGKNLRQLTFNQNTNRYYPAWSPDGKQIVFDSNDLNGTKALMSVSVEDGKIREVFRANKPGDRFFMSSWSPDGNNLIWCCGMEMFELRIGNVSDGKYRRFALDNSKEDYYVWPCWSPNGNKILFTGLKDVDQLMVMENFLPVAIASVSK